jgi:hypothetical protein
VSFFLIGHVAASILLTSFLPPSLSNCTKQVPAYKPVEALALFEAYINDNIWRAEKKT